MAEVTHDDLWVCSDCLMAIAYDDYTGLDAYLITQEERNAKEEAIRAGLASVGGYWVPCDGSLEYSRLSCDCCGNSCPGERHECAVLDGEKGENQ